MPPIRKMESRDVDALAAHFPDKRERLFNEYYLEQLQNRHLVLVAVEAVQQDNGADEKKFIYYGYACIVWEATYTQFWRRHIPEIGALEVTEAHRRQGIGTALVQACEDIIREKGFPTVGAAIGQDEENEGANQLFSGLGYVFDGSDRTSSGDIRYFVKSLSQS